MTTIIRIGQAPPTLTREAFGQRYRAQFYDPAFEAEKASIARLEAIAWQAYEEGRKAPRTRRAGEGFADPTYELSLEWLATRDRLGEAQTRWSKTETPSRVLVICGSSRNDGTCPGEISKTWRFTELARHVVQAEGLEADVLDLSLLASEYGRKIHPCKGCVSTAMPLCHALQLRPESFARPDAHEFTPGSVRRLLRALFQQPRGAGSRRGRGGRLSQPDKAVRAVRSK